MTLGCRVFAPALAQLALVLTLCGCDGCNVQRSKPSATVTPSAATTSPSATATSQTTAAPASNGASWPSRGNARPPADEIAKLGNINWTQSVNWVPYEQAVALAKQSGKRIFVLVYADWCIRCRALAPVLERDDVRGLLSQMIAVRQDQDEPAPWLHELDTKADYVPRIMFLNSDGTLQRRLVSGHGRYPFFYPADRPDALLGSLQGALSI